MTPSPELQSAPPRALPIEKRPRIFQEVLGILRICSVASIRVHDELSVWQMLRQNESVDRCHYDVFVAVNNQCRMCDAFQGGVTSGRWDRSPLPDRGNLRDGRVPRHRKIRIIFARLESLHVFASSSLAGFRGKEERSQQESHDVKLLQAEGSAESDARFRHLRDYVRSFSSGSANARIVKEDHLMIRGKAVDYLRIPAIHVGVEVLQKEQRNRARFAESAEGVTDTIGLNKLCGDRFVCVIAHRLCPSDPILNAYGMLLAAPRSRSIHSLI